MANREIVMTEWKSGTYGCIGIVLVKTSVGKFRAYIGIAPNTGGGPDEDAENIADWGSKLNFREAQAFFPLYLKEKEDYVS